MAGPVGSVRGGVNVRDVEMEIDDESCCCCCPFFGSKKKPAVAERVQARANVELRPAARTEREVRAEQPAAAAAAMSVDEQNPPVPYPAAAAAAAGAPVQQSELNVAALPAEKLEKLKLLRWKVVEDMMDKVFEKLGKILGEEIDWCYANLVKLENGKVRPPEGAEEFELPINKDGSGGGLICIRPKYLLDKYTKNLEAREAALVGSQKRCYEAVLGRIQEMQNSDLKRDYLKCNELYPTTWRLSRIEPQAAAGNAIKSKLVRNCLISFIQAYFRKDKKGYDELFS